MKPSRFGICTRGSVSASSTTALLPLVAMIYSITSSARASRSGVISMPMDLAALRLITRSNLSGAWTRQVGRIRAAQDTINIRRGAPVLAHQIDSVNRQSSVGRPVTERIDCRNAMTLCRSKDRCPIIRGPPSAAATSPPSDARAKISILRSISAGLPTRIGFNSIAKEDATPDIAR